MRWLAVQAGSPGAEGSEDLVRTRRPQPASPADGSVACSVWQAAAGFQGLAHSLAAVPLRTPPMPLPPAAPCDFDTGLAI